MSEFLIFLLGLVAGSTGYLLVTFICQPILRYRELRYSVISDLVFYRNTVNAYGLDNDMKTRLNERIAANRRHAADLAAIYYQLPRVFRVFLLWRGVDLIKANSELLGLSNTFDVDQATKRIERIQKHLKIEPPVVG